MSVIEQEAPSIAPSVVAAIRKVDAQSFRREGLLPGSVTQAAVSILSLVGVCLVWVGVLMICLNPRSLLLVLIGLSPMTAGKMLAEARHDLVKAQRLLLAVVRETA